MQRALALFLCIVLATGGCVSPAARALQLESDSAELRQVQTRRFDTHDEAMLLQASAALLQDLGFNLDDSEAEVGLIYASKERTAVEPQQVAGAVVGTVIVTAIAVVIGVLSGGGGMGGDTTVPYDEKQHMRVCLVTRPVANGTIVRVTFQRIVWNSKGRVSKQEPLQEPEHYVEFFDRLSKAVFLEAHDQ